MMKAGVGILPKNHFNIRTCVRNVCDHWLKKKKEILLNRRHYCFVPNNDRSRRVQFTNFSVSALNSQTLLGVLSGPFHIERKQNYFNY